MNQAMRQIAENPAVLLLPLLLFSVTVLAGFIVRKLLFGAVRRWSAGTESHIGALVTNTLHGPIVLWAIILGVHVATQNSELPSRWLRPIPTTLESLWVLS